PLLLLHGLFGKGRNWTSLAKSFARVLHRPVYTVDLRNHGSSPHSDIMTYDAMAADVLHLCDKHSLSNISLLGHSMGGKVAMTVALSSSLPSDLIKSLIVADIAPSRGRLSPDFEMYLQAMHKIEDAKLKTRKEADHMLHEFVKETPIRQFLLTNLDAHSHPLKFSIPLKIISESITNIGDFPHHPDDGALYYGRTLFIKGEKSRYINEKNVQHAYAMFPDMEIKTLHTGHWGKLASPCVQS
ncbi:alpha/beta-hydrolase, partial [Stereum hirsutum FP-91666 SS1]|uniref:alpha/beta-hydrolase n=1 Tax=Stereum hirsutum (strain FP-91666) TaxID=721885 RepID=UPI000440D1E6